MDSPTVRLATQSRWDFTGSVVVITGAARGQGRTHALAFAEAGAKLVLSDTDSQISTISYPLGTLAELERTAEECREFGAEVITASCDVRDAAQVAAMVDGAVAAFGGIDVLVSNAGVVSLCDVVDMSEQMWDEVVDVNLKGSFLVARAVAPVMTSARRGKMIMVGSINGFAGVPSAAHYVASKHGVVGLTKVLAIEMAPYQVNVNCVCPTAVDTVMAEAVTGPGVPADYGERMVQVTGSWNLLEEGAPPIQPAQVTEAVLFLASDSSDAVTGIALPVDAGFLSK